MAHAIVRAVELRTRIATAHFKLEHRVHKTLERLDFQRHRFGYAMARRVTRDSDRRIAMKANGGPLERRRRVFVDIKEPVRFHVFVERRIASIDRRHFNCHADCTSFSGAVERYE